MRTLDDIKEDYEKALEGVSITAKEYSSLLAQGSNEDDYLLSIRFKNQYYSSRVADLEKEAVECVNIGHVYEIYLKSINIPHSKYFWKVIKKKTKYIVLERVGHSLGEDFVPETITIKAIALKEMQDKEAIVINDLADLGF